MINVKKKKNQKQSFFDLSTDTNRKLLPLEIKWSHTQHLHFKKSIHAFNKIPSLFCLSIFYKIDQFLKTNNNRINYKSKNVKIFY